MMVITGYYLALPYMMYFVLIWAVSSMSFGREDPEMKLVHLQMKKYLKLEEEAMEERIRLGLPMVN